MEYEYTGKATEPNMTNLQFVDVPASAMTDKDITECEWHESTQILHIICPVAKSAGDKAILDGLVVDNS